MIVAGGLAIGAAISWAVSEIPQRLLKFSEDDDPATGVVLTILIVTGVSGGIGLLAGQSGVRA